MNRVHVNFTRHTMYMVVKRRRGCRNWTTVATSRTENRARQELAKLVRSGGDWRYARLLGCQEWYEPNVLVEVKQ